MLQFIGCICMIRVMRSTGQLAVAREGATMCRGQCALIGRLDGDDQIGAIRDHHIRNLHNINTEC